MANFNKVLLMGNLTRNPELKYTPNGTAVTEFGLATNRNYTSAAGDKKEEVCFVDITFFGKKAEVINEYFSKGKPIFIEGRLKFDSWETGDGQRRSKLRVVAENFVFIGQRGDAPRSDGPSAPQVSDNDIDMNDIASKDDDIPF